MDWIVIATAPDQVTAEMWTELLHGRGVRCRLHPGDITGFLGVSPHSVRILAPSEDSVQAREVLEEVVGDSGEEDR